MRLSSDFAARLRQFQDRLAAAENGQPAFREELTDLTDRTDKVATTRRETLRTSQAVKGVSEEQLIKAKVQVKEAAGQMEAAREDIERSKALRAAIDERQIDVADSIIAVVSYVVWRVFGMWGETAVKLAICNWDAVIIVSHE